MIYLDRITRRDFPDQLDGFPFSLPLVQQLDTLPFTAPVTFFVGDNGTGKSTLLESIACAVGSITVGTQPVSTDPTLAQQRELAKYLRTGWAKRTKRGFFLRAEDFFGFAKQVANTQAELRAGLAEVSELHVNAQLPFKHELGAIKRRYGAAGLDGQSHGESFLRLFQSRFVPGGLYLLDEPETPLSPLRQLTFLTLLKNMIAQDAQFIIATHSPILMAFPDAQILHFENGNIAPAAYDSLEHVTLTRDFLNNPRAYLKHL